MEESFAGLLWLNTQHVSDRTRHRVMRKGTQALLGKESDFCLQQRMQNPSSRSERRRKRVPRDDLSRGHCGRVPLRYPQWGRSCQANSFGPELLSHCQEEVETVLNTQTVGICTLQDMWKHTLTLCPHGVQCK